MQRAHRGDEADDAAFGPGLPRGLLHPFDGVNDFHEAGRPGRAPLLCRGCRALTIERDQVRGHGLGSALAQQRGDLPAMIGAVIGQMLQRLPAQAAVRIALQVAIVKGRCQVRAGKLVDVFAQVSLDFARARG